MKTRACDRCHTEFSYEPALWGEREIFIPRFCDPCVMLLRADEDREKERDRLGAMREAWLDICPPVYRDTDPTDPRLSTKARDALSQWVPDGGRSIGLCGMTGRGKTRLSFLRLRDLHMAGIPVYAVSAKRLERSIHQSFHDDANRKWEALDVLDRARKTKILLLDDMGKEKFTERVASEFYDLIEWRTSNRLPIVWTANVGPETLKARLGDEHGQATVRRLVEFSTVVTV